MIKKNRIFAFENKNVIITTLQGSVDEIVKLQTSSEIVNKNENKNIIY